MSGLLDQLGLPPVERVVYENPPLVLALCQIKFSNVLSVSQTTFVAPFQRAIEDVFPLATLLPQVEFEITPGVLGPIKQSSTSQWRFTDVDDTWAVVLTQDSLAIETRMYEDFSVFLHHLQIVLEALRTHIKPRIFNRIGLRYVDEIRLIDTKLIDTNWTSIISSELLGPLAVSNLIQKTHIANQGIQLHFSDAQGININHGMFPQGSIVQARQEEAFLDTPFYFLDFDVYQSIPRSKGRSMTTDMICNKVSEFNKVIYRLFRWSVTDKYVATLGVRL